MGSARAGKTSLVGQFLYAAYSPRYRPTVEDMHTVELDCQGILSPLVIHIDCYVYWVHAAFISEKLLFMPLRPAR